MVLESVVIKTPSRQGPVTENYGVITDLRKLSEDLKAEEGM